MRLMRRDDVTSGKPATMVTQEGNSLIGQKIEKPRVERDMDMVDLGEASGKADQKLGKNTPVLLVAASE